MSRQTTYISLNRNHATFQIIWSVFTLQFLLIFRKAAAGELDTDSGLSALARLTEIDVDKEGVGGAKDFFEAKVGPYVLINLSSHF